jgi:hypothetical protein
MQKHSNILKMAPYFDYYKQLMERITKTLDNNTEPIIIRNIEKENDDVIMKVSEVPSEFGIETVINEKNFKKLKVHELNGNEKKFIIDVNIVDIYPKNIENFVMLLCKNCQEK